MLYKPPFRAHTYEHEVSAASSNIHEPESQGLKSMETLYEYLSLCNPLVLVLYGGFCLRDKTSWILLLHTMYLYSDR